MRRKPSHSAAHPAGGGPCLDASPPSLLSEPWAALLPWRAARLAGSVAPVGAAAGVSAAAARPAASSRAADPAGAPRRADLGPSPGRRAACRDAGECSSRRAARGTSPRGRQGARCLRARHSLHHAGGDTAGCRQGCQGSRCKPACLPSRAGFCSTGEVLGTSESALRG